MFGSFLFAFTLIYHSTFRMNQIIYLAVEFSPLAEADFHILTKAAKTVPSRRQAPYGCILTGHTDGFPRFGKHRICSPQKPSRLAGFSQST